MDFIEFGKENLPTILILDIGNWKEIPDVFQLQKYYHVIIPLIRKSTDMDTVTDGIQQKCSGHVYAICVLHTGWPVVRRLLEKHCVSADKTVVEGPECVPGEFAVRALLTYQ